MMTIIFWNSAPFALYFQGKHVQMLILRTLTHVRYNEN